MSCDAFFIEGQLEGNSPVVVKKETLKEAHDFIRNFLKSDKTKILSVWGAENWFLWEDGQIRNYKESGGE